MNLARVSRSQPRRDNNSCEGRTNGSLPGPYLSLGLNDQWLTAVSSKVVRHIVEHRIDLSAQVRHGRHCRDRDQRSDERIFDRVGALLAAKDIPKEPHFPTPW